MCPMIVRLGHLIPLAITVHSQTLHDPVVPIIIGDKQLSRHNDAMLGHHGTIQPVHRDITTQLVLTESPSSRY
jgi:hypothetical protein